MTYVDMSKLVSDRFALDIEGGGSVATLTAVIKVMPQFDAGCVSDVTVRDDGAVILLTLRNGADAWELIELGAMLARLGLAWDGLHVGRLMTGKQTIEIMGVKWPA